MQCQNCGKKEQVIINQKQYCANCGEPFARTELSPQATDQSAEPPATNVLDLSQPTPERPHRPSQTVHGVRKPVTGKASLPPTIKPSVVKPSQRHETHQQRAIAAKRHPAVSKFRRAPAEPTVKHNQTHPAQPDPSSMRPHTSYNLTASQVVPAPPQL